MYTHIHATKYYLFYGLKNGLVVCVSIDSAIMST